MSSKITAAAVVSMKEVVVFHAGIMLLFLAFLNNDVAQYAVFLNLACLCERVWAIQLQTLTYWPVTVQGVFVASRLFTVTVIIVLFVVAVRIKYTA
jgi:hypothetical protein